jgi:hypothetical protein
MQAGASAPEGVDTEASGRCAMTRTFEERIVQRDVARDTRLLGDFTALYCRANHAGAVRTPLESDGARCGVYRRKVPVVCAECADLLRYSERRRAFCPLDPKPFCTACETHCYTPEKAEEMRVVMRYSGPRSLLRGHAIEGLKHARAVRRHKAAARRAAG